jgi:MFS superfamily sulfate permease-like transporter
MGIALASGAPLFSGIIAGVVGGIVIGSISNSSLGVSGPAAGLTVIVLSSIQVLGTFEAFLLAVVLAGIIQVIMGVLHAGVIVHYFPSAVIKGMLTAIGIIIILKQIPHAIGYDADYEGDMSFFQADGENTFTALISMLNAITPGAIIVCLISLSILFLWDTVLTKKFPKTKLIQGPLVVVVFGILYQMITSKYLPELSMNPKQLVTVPVAGDEGGFINLFTQPSFEFVFSNSVWIVALTIAIVASLETLLSVEATDKLDPQKRTTNPNRELIAQGSGNIISGLLGGLPLTQVILRSSANVQSGAKTKMSTILHGILLLICVLSIPNVLNFIPLAALAAILFMIGYKLANPTVIQDIYRLGPSQFLPFIATVIGIVLTDLLRGIGLGMAVAVIIILRNSYKNSHFLHRENLNGSRKVKMTLAEEVFFLNKGAIANELKKVPDGSELVIDMSKSVHIDFDVLEVINNFQKHAETRNIAVKVVNKEREEVTELIYH